MIWVFFGIELQLRFDTRSRPWYESYYLEIRLYFDTRRKAWLRFETPFEWGYSLDSMRIEFWSFWASEDLHKNTVLILQSTERHKYLVLILESMGYSQTLRYTITFWNSKTRKLWYTVQNAQITITFWHS